MHASKRKSTQRNDDKLNAAQSGVTSTAETIFQIVLYCCTNVYGKFCSGIGFMTSSFDKNLSIRRIMSRTITRENSNGLMLISTTLEYDKLADNLFEPLPHEKIKTTERVQMRGDVEVMVEEGSLGN